MGQVRSEGVFDLVCLLIRLGPHIISSVAQRKNLGVRAELAQGFFRGDISSPVSA